MLKVVVIAIAMGLIGCSQHTDGKATAAAKQEEAINAAVAGVQTKEDREAAAKALRAIAELNRKRAEAAEHAR